MDRVLRASRSTAAHAGPAEPRCSGYCRVHGRAGSASVARSGRSLRRACLHAVGTEVKFSSSRPDFGPLRRFVVPPHAAVPTRKRDARGRRRGGRLRSAKFLFTPSATPPSARAVVRRDRCSRAARRSGCLLKKRAGGAGKADEGVAGGVKARSASVKAHIAQRCDAGANKNSAERSRLPRRRLCLNGPRTQRRTADFPKDRNGPTAIRAGLALRAPQTAPGAVEQLT